LGSKNKSGRKSAALQMAYSDLLRGREDFKKLIEGLRAVLMSAFGFRSARDELPALRYRRAFPM
jgi:hypothetical protein